ncbi:hypothetical protein ACJMK2_013966, partial [Sinanodonta woodiana]
NVETSFPTDVANIRSKALLNDTYDPVARPNQTVYVKAGFNLLNIVSLDIKHQSLKVIGWITLVSLPNGEWILDRTEIDEKVIQETKSDGTIVTFSQLEFVFVLERRPIFYVVNILLPIVLASFLSCVAFLLPLQSGEKVTYILTLILALAVLLTLIADSLPHTSITASVLGLYLAFTLFISVISALISVLLLSNFHSEEDVDITSCFYRFTKFIASISYRKRCMVRPKRESGRNLKKAGNKVFPNRTLFVVISNNVGEYEEKVYTRKELSQILDRFCFWLAVDETKERSGVCAREINNNGQEKATKNELDDPLDDN